MSSPDLVVFHARITPCAEEETRMGRIEELATIEDGALVVRSGKVVRVGESERVLSETTLGPDTRLLDAEGRALIPGFLDPHSHALHAGRRIPEMQLRQEGKGYLEILQAGGGIQETVRATTAADDAAVVRDTRRRIGQAVACGTTTVEVKTGYGLTPEREMRLLRLLAQVRRRAPITILRTFLGLHAWPLGTEDRPVHIAEMNALLSDVAAKDLAEMVDVFCEEGVFSPAETLSHLAAARAAGLAIRLHADELRPSGGAELAAEIGARSADHLLAATDEGLRAMAEAGVVGVNLPGTAFFLHEHPLQAERQRAVGLRAALATDQNPGSSPTFSMPMVLSLAMHMAGFRPAEALLAATRNAASALGLEGTHGQLAEGFAADFLLLDDSDYRVLFYAFGMNPVAQVFAAGRSIAHDGRLTEEMRQWMDS
ncbi:MAG: imidazolonepropionase [Thermaerobacter sp.]|nr:imidazolonepropionase [Thermaerobacter sp.]